MNIEKLYRIADSNRAASLYFRAFSTRRRAFAKTWVQDVIDLGRRNRLMLAPAEVEEFFHALEEADCGQYLRDSPEGSHFHWLVKSTETARAALKKHEALAPLAQVSNQSTVTHELLLRADWTLELKLPTNFSPAEAERICHFVRALPISAE